MLQQVEWRWHALIQLATQLAATLACWDSESMGFVYVWLSMGMKALVIGVVNMQRLDDKRVVSNQLIRVSCDCARLKGPKEHRPP